MNEKHQDKKGKAICKYYIEGRCTWVRVMFLIPNNHIMDWSLVFFKVLVSSFGVLEG